jgi:spore germination cell wall hydrolase CwlJ-like protein
MEVPHDTKSPDAARPTDSINRFPANGPVTIQSHNLEAKLLFPAKRQWLSLIDSGRFRRGWDEARTYVWANRDDLIKGVTIGLVGLCLIALPDSIGPTQRQAADPIARMIKTAQGDLSPRGLRRISAGMSPYAQGVSERLASGGAEWTPKGPPGWPAYDLARLPTLLQHDLTFDEARDFNSYIPVADLPLAVMKPFILPVKTGQERTRAEECLSQAVYYEAGFETGEGQEAVAQIILNRLRHPAYPKSVCGVVYEGSQRASGCQFSFTCDGSLTRKPSAAAWARSQFVARQALDGFVYRPVGSATHYHAEYVFPFWAATLVKLRQIGAHIFYRMTGPSGAADAFDGRYEGGETVLSPEILGGGDALTPNAPSVKPVVAPAPPPQTFTMTLGGETKTYLLGPPEARGLAPGEIPVAVPSALTPVRRKPTPEEIADINRTLQLLEDQQKARPENQPTASLPPAPMPAP